MPRVRVVLVRPEAPVNVGAAARVVRNTGLEGLDLVDPGDWRTVECWRTAWGAHEVLEQARGLCRPRLRRRPGRLCPRLHRPARERRARASTSATRPPRWRPSRRTTTAALVFGPETSGLTQDELALCGRRAFIPSHPDQPSLNLSHAVMVAAYEVFRARGPAPARTAPRHQRREGGAARPAARRAARRRRPCPPTTPTPTSAEWRALVQRADLTTAGGAPARAHGAQDGPGLSRAWPTSSVPSRTCGRRRDGFSIPELKWRELLFVGALRPRGRGVRPRPVAAAAALPDRRPLSGGRSGSRPPPRGVASASAGRRLGIIPVRCPEPRL